MREEDKRSANDRQIEVYFTSYDRFWRLNKLLLIKRHLEQRNDLEETLAGFYGEDYFNYETLVYENITNGLIADAISETVMLCEDYFAILKLIRERYFFVKRMVTYKAGAITAIAQKLKSVSENKLRLLFFIPSEDFVATNFARGNAATANAEIKQFNKRLGILMEAHNEAINFYARNSELHTLYKHGLKLCLNGLGQGLKDEAIEARKQELSANIWKFDNNNANLSGMLVPNINPAEIRNNASELLKDRNLLHLGITTEVHIDCLISVAKSILNGISILVSNRVALAAINSKGTDRIEVSLPSGNPERITSLAYQFYSFPGCPIPNIDNYQVRL